MSTEEIDNDRFSRLFFPYAYRKISELKNSGGRFVYYTTADVATSILKNQQIWLRNATVMNDFMEIQYGFECLAAAYRGDPGRFLKAVLESYFPGISKEVEEYFNSWLPVIRSETYLTCVSEHHSDEDQNGRLSMWRAYGGSTGVALVMNGAVMFSTSDVLHAYSSPVYYASQAEFAEEFMKVAEGIKAESDYIMQLGRENVKNTVFNMLRFAVLCTKHPGFHEELEWRVFASPIMQPSARLSTVVEVVRGVPQMVVKIKLENAPSEGLIGLSLPELLDRIIIGPCEFPAVIFRAFLQLLKEMEVPDAKKKIIISDIPLRQHLLWN